MSATIRYVSVNTDGKVLPTYAPSSLVDSLRRAFDQFPLQLGPGDVPTGAND